MKYTATFVGAMTAFALVCSAYAGSVDHAASKSAVETIRLLEEVRNQAILHGDAAALERMTSDDYTFVTLRGEMLTKAEVVRNFELLRGREIPVSGDLRFEDTRLRQFRVVTRQAVERGSGKRQGLQRRLLVYAGRPGIKVVGGLPLLSRRL